MTHPPLIGDTNRDRPVDADWIAPPPVVSHDPAPEKTTIEYAELAGDTGPENLASPPVRLIEAEFIEERVAVVDERSLPFWFADQLALGFDWLFGMASLVAGLAVLATLPVLQFLTLGYMLEASGRIARTGRFSQGFVGVRKASRVGSLVLGTWLMLLPLRFLRETWAASWLIDPESQQTTGLRILLFVATALILGHIAAAWYCGGRLRHFFWPLVAPLFLSIWAARMVLASEALRPITRPIIGGISPRLLADINRTRPLTSWFPPAILWAALRRFHMYSEARDAVWKFVVGLRLPYYFWLGVRGFVGAVAWLFLPTVLLIGTTQLPDPEGAIAFLCFAVGSILLTWVILYLPFLQTHFAAEGRFVAMFEVGHVRRAFHRAPIAFWFSLLVTLALALPLFLLKVELTDREIVGVLSFFFIVFMLPARILTGWAVARGRKRARPRWWPLHAFMRVAEVPVVGFYVFLVFFTQFFAWYGSRSLFEQHPFLLPAPFFQW